MTHSWKGMVGWNYGGVVQPFLLLMKAVLEYRGKTQPRPQGAVCGSLCPYLSVSQYPDSMRRGGWCMWFKEGRKLALVDGMAVTYRRECVEEGTGAGIGIANRG